MDFWDVHNFGFVICMCFFPRLTLLFSSVQSGGLFWWLGWLVAPRLLVAILATKFYWDTNALLVVVTWIWACVGEGREKDALR